MKSIFKSRTFAFNTLTTLASIVAVFAGAEWIQNYPQIVAALGIASGIVNVLLRYVTTEPVSL